MTDLSPRQLEVLAYILQFSRERGMPPTRGEIASGLGLRNRQGIDQHLRALQAKGAIELMPGISRGIRMPAPPAPGQTAPETTPKTTLGSGRGSGRKPESETNPFHRAGREVAPAGLPLLGRIAAGSPILATGNIEDHLEVDPDLFRPRANFLLRVRGDSMKDADILDNDLLAVHHTTQARNGQIVVARLGDEATVKYYRRQGRRAWLEPANPAYQPIEIDLRKQELMIEGLAVGVIRTSLPNSP